MKFNLAIFNQLFALSKKSLGKITKILVFSSWIFLVVYNIFSTRAILS